MKIEVFACLIHGMDNIFMGGLSLFYSVCNHISCSRFRMWIPLSKSVALSIIMHLLCTTTFDSCISISITPSYVSINACTSMDGCISTSMKFSSLLFVYVACASINCCFIVLSSFYSSINTRSTDVAHGLVSSLAPISLLVLRKNSITYVIVLFILWIIIFANYIFSLYAFPSIHYEDDEYGGDLIANGWILNTPSCSTFRNSSYVFFFSTIPFPPPVSIRASFSFAILYSFSIIVSTLMLLWTLKLKKCS
jgi:hypothetical protein